MIGHNFSSHEMLDYNGLISPGVLNIIHGTHDSVNFICDHPDIRAISFVGSNQAVSLSSKRENFLHYFVMCHDTGDVMS